MNLKNNPELIPLIDWWEKDGKQFVLWLAIAAVAVGAYYGVKNHRAAVRTAASAALVNAYTIEEMEDAVSKFSGTKAQGALRIRLAKGYFDAGRYEEAMSLYEELIANPPEGFVDIPVVGRAQCLEALGKFEDARTAFDAFVEANPSNYLKVTAQLGGARCLVEAGDAKAALKRIETLKTDYKDDELVKARIESTEDVIKRFGQKASAPVEKPAPVLTTNAVEKVVIKDVDKPIQKSIQKPVETSAEKPAK